MTQDSFVHKGKRKILVEYLQQRIGITDQNVLSAMNEVPRHLFIESIFEDFAYEDRAFPILAHQTISHPSTVAEQSELLQVIPGEKVLEIGTGFMMVQREVFPKFAEAYPQLKYKPDHVGQAHFDGSRYIHAYFDTVIDKESERYLSEDYMFCQWWRNIGGKIYLCPWMRTDHIGTYHFKGDMPAVANYVGEM